MSNMSNNRLIATLMVVVTLTVSISIVLCRLWLKDISFTNQVIKKKNLANTTLEQNVAALPTLESGFKTLENEGPRASAVLKALPTTPDYAAFSSEVEAMAALAGARLAAVVLQADTVGTAAPTAGQVTAPVEVVYSLNVTGSYPNLQNFLRNLETAKRPIRINKLAISGSEGSVTLEANVTNYYQPLTVIGDEKEVVTE
ncbi:hypothetical protein HY346_01035 [Candidatus Microgenomates bacterium]|nr:hypothetical protein [Candidatus Microgenomates bacterium]